jgi:hypothetical protein
MTERFKAFLASALKFDSEESWNQIVADVEGMMTDFICAEIDPNFALYAVEGDTSKGDWYLTLRQRLISKPSLAAGFDCTRLKVVLKHYANFVKSKEFLSNKATLSDRELVLKKRGTCNGELGTGGGHAGRVTLPGECGNAGRVTLPVDGDYAGCEPLPGGGDHVRRVTLPVVLEEGAIKEMHIAKRERNSELRKACIEYYMAQNEGRIACAACGMAYGEVYGEIGEGYIEVHHLSPISQIEGVHKVDPKADLVPLCANCHAMIHRLMSAEKKTTGKELEGPEALSKLKGSFAGYVKK